MALTSVLSALAVAFLFIAIAKAIQAVANNRRMDVVPEEDTQWGVQIPLPPVPLSLLFGHHRKVTPNNKRIRRSWRHPAAPNHARRLAMKANRRAARCAKRAA